jgi:fucose 4-O-acetylase-like acetyltransferase
MNSIVPVFLFISGYLFFFGFNTIREKEHAKLFKEKIERRLQTLGLPYLFWCIFWFLFLLIIQNLPFLQSYFPSPLYKMSLWQQFWNLFLEPINYPFWFIRELFLYVLIAPVIYLTINYLGFYILIILFIASLFQTSLFTIWDISAYKFFMLLFYLSGAYFALKGINLAVKLSLIKQLSLVIFWFILSGVLIILELKYGNDIWQMNLLSKFTTIIGCLSIWTTYDFFDKKYKFEYKEVYSFGFFIYATHGIPILLLKKTFINIFEPTNLELLLFYSGSFIAVSWVCILIGKVVKKLVPNLYFFTTGNR